MLILFFASSIKLIYTKFRRCSQRIVEQIKLRSLGKQIFFPQEYACYAYLILIQFLLIPLNEKITNELRSSYVYCCQLSECGCL